MNKARKRILAKQKKGETTFCGSTALACLFWIVVILAIVFSGRASEQKVTTLDDQAPVEARR
ncbi:MAG: hypothetical protein WCW66_06640 [Patescibacteria group bacterium]